VKDPVERVEWRAEEAESTAGLQDVLNRLAPWMVAEDDEEWNSVSVQERPAEAWRLVEILPRPGGCYLVLLVRKVRAP